MPRYIHTLPLLLTLSLLGGCATVTPLPVEITHAPPGNLQLVEAMRSPAKFVGERVRWGGTVVAVSGEGDGVMRIEVLERKLESGGRPLEYTASDGRFVIRAAPEVDPWQFRVGSDVTVAGTVTAWVQTSTGAKAPLVEVRHFARWAAPYRYHHNPYYYDDPLWGRGPWYHDPWYRYGYPSGIRYGVGVQL